MYKTLCSSTGTETICRTSGNLHHPIQRTKWSGTCLNIYRKLSTSSRPQLNYALPQSQCPDEDQGHSAPLAIRAQMGRNLAPQTLGAWTGRQTYAIGDGQTEMAQSGYTAGCTEGRRSGLHQNQTQPCLWVVGPELTGLRAEMKCSGQSLVEWGE
jgi:hypothetical protein